MAITMDGREARWEASAADGPDSRARDRAFRRARRHSRLVRAMRFALPVFAVGLLGYYALTLGVSWQLGAGRLKVDEVQLTADDLTMKNPRYFGLTKDGGSYEVRAQKAILEFNKEAPIKLIDIDGDLRQPNNVVTKLKAKRGTLDNAKSELELYEGIEIDATNGMKARLSRATVYSKEHRVVSKEPVDLMMPTGRVQGASMTLRTDTREASFVGDVKTRLVSSAQPGQARPPTPAFGRDSDKPVDVTSDQLYVNDTSKTATFMGKVVAVQGESTLKTSELYVTYEGAPAAGDLAGTAARQPGDGSRLSRLLAKDGAVITMGADRRISSDQADFDAKAETALFLGNVLVNQQRNVLQGKRLFIDRKSGKSRLETPAEGDQPAGRIAATFYQGDGKTAAQSKSKRAGPAPQAMQNGMFGTFKADPNAPMDVEADTLDVDDSEKRAVFHGNVKSQQGDVVIRTVELTAFYTGQAGLGLAGGEEAAGKAAQSQLTRVEAKQKVLITTKDGQSASGDWATFDTKANVVLMGDNVTVSRGKDVVQGSRLKIDLTSGMYRFEVEQEPVADKTVPATSASPPLAAQTPTDPATRPCPPGKQCLLFYPKEAQEKAKEAVRRAAPDAARAGEAWQPSTSASPAMRSE